MAVPERSGGMEAAERTEPWKAGDTGDCGSRLTGPFVLVLYPVFFIRSEASIPGASRTLAAYLRRVLMILISVESDFLPDVVHFVQVVAEV